MHYDKQQQERAVAEREALFGVTKSEYNPTTKQVVGQMKSETLFNAVTALESHLSWAKLERGDDPKTVAEEQVEIIYEKLQTLYFAMEG